MVQAGWIEGGVHFHGARRPKVRPHQLPAAPGGFVGRDHELAALTEAVQRAVEQGATVVISALGGVGGVGKTWLAAYWAHRHAELFPDGQLFVNLRGFDPADEPVTPQEAVRGFLDAFGVGLGDIPADFDAQVGLYRSLIAERRVLIVLDNARDSEQVAPLLATSPGVRLVGVYEEIDAPEWMREASKEVADDLGVPLLTKPPEVDFAVVCSEPTRHARLAADVLRSGGRMLVDKPVATELPDAAELMRLAGPEGARCAVMSRVLVPGLRRARSWVDAGYVGLPRHVDVEFLAHGARFATSVERPELVVDPALSGGGELLNFGGYAIDAIHHLTGCAVVEVYAETATLFSTAHAELGVEDLAVLSLGLEHGVTATATVGRVPAAPTFSANAATLRLIGSRGSFAVDDDSPALLRYAEDGSCTARSAAGPAARQGIAAVLGDVVEAFATGRAPVYTILEAHRTLAVLDAAYRSVATGTPQPVQDG